MTFPDVLQLAIYYAGFAVSVFALPFGSIVLWRHFKVFADPGFKGAD